MTPGSTIPGSRMSLNILAAKQRREMSGLEIIALHTEAHSLAKLVGRNWQQLIIGLS